MSTVLRRFDWTQTSRFNSKPRTRFYPWKGPKGWFNGQIHELVPGVDFDGPAYSMERVVRTTANRQGQKVRVRVVANETGTALIESLRAKIEKAKGQSMTLSKEVVAQLLALAEGSGDNTVVLQQHDDEDTARRVTRSPSAASLAEAPSTNGETAAPAKRAKATKAATKAAAPTKAGVSKRPAATKAAASKRPTKKVAASA